MTHVACRSKLRSVVRSSMHLCPGTWMAIERAVVYYARAAHAFSAGIKCRHCTSKDSFSTFTTFVPVTPKIYLVNSVLSL